MEMLSDALDDAISALSDAADEANRAGNEKMSYVLNKMADAVTQMMIDVEGIEGC
jgi:hypothetical protein